MIELKRRPSLLGAVLILLDDGCPPEPGTQLCQIEDVDDGTACGRCWRRYVFYVANGRKGAIYQHQKHQKHQQSI